MDELADAAADALERIDGKPGRAVAPGKNADGSEEGSLSWIGNEKWIPRGRLALPFPVHMAVKEDAFVGFCFGHRDRLLPPSSATAE
jgi:hypothetical protein